MRKKTIEIDWQWPGWVPKGSLVTVYGDGETAKSFVLLAAAVSIASATPLFDGAPSSGAPVLYLSHLENPHEENERRLQAITHGHRLNYKAYRNALVLVDSARPLLSEAGYPELEALIEEHAPKTIVLDSYATHSALPAKGANDPDTVQALLNRTVLPLARQGITVYGLAHAAKGSGDRPRGATTWYNAADACIAVNARHVGDHDRTTLAHVKGRRGGKDNRPVWVEFHDLNAEKTSIAIRSGRAGAVLPVPGDAIPKKLRPLVRFIEQNGPVSTERVARYLKSASRATVERLLAEALGLGLVARPERGLYTLPDVENLPSNLPSDVREA